MDLYRRGGVYWCDFTYHGKRVRKSTGKTDKYLAGLQAHEYLQKAQDNGGVDILLRKAPILETFAVEFLEWVTENQSFGKYSRKLYRNGWRLLKATPLAEMPMDKITNHHCETICFPGGPCNANTALKTLKRMFRIAKETKKLFGDLPKIVLREEEPRSIEISSEDAMLIDSHWLPGESSENSRDAFRIIRSSGMRPSETFRMRWEFVDWQRLVYRNPKGKTKTSRREVPLNFPPFNCMEILKARHERAGSPCEGWVFPSPTAAEGHLTTINEAFNRARNKAGLPTKMVLYCARHGAATAVADVATLKETMQLLGHSHVETALRYQHPKSKQIGERLWGQMRTNGSVQ